ncbi:hypothetical protein RM844_24365 [Streptomyces sp. DSM 44915]|uniref:DUF4235 domain-containing protein n=1 Tax=Streptomyces chisholmiae TaxID=3075540 RepID=A0ABU2JWT3_9ACTN|nr:hypothetical protein [Streptomyces sp. DSM 44915]MDT0269420.1 hypothetical protein [Streptomyces sp. DSM 44915]
MSKKPKSKISTYFSIGGSLIGAFGVVKQVREAREEQDTLRLVDAAVSAAAIVTTIALLTRELRRMQRDGDDVLSD